MKKIIPILLVISLISILIVSLVFAEEIESPLEETTLPVEETVSTFGEISPTVKEVLTVSEPILLPHHRLYFLKEWWRRLRLGLTGNPIKRAEIQLQVLNEKLAETEKVARLAPRQENIEKAFDNYQEAMERLKRRIEALEGTSENPQIDKLLDKLSERMIRHQEVLDKILTKRQEIKEKAEETRELINQVLPPLHLKFESQQQFMERLEEKLQELPPLLPKAVGEFRQLRIMETLKTNLEKIPLEDLPPQIQEKIEKVQERVETRIRQRLDVLQKQGFSEEVIKKIIEDLPEPQPKIIPQPEQGILPPRYQSSQGIPPEKIVPPHFPQGSERFCLALYDPVCGEDGQTYSNSCYAEIAGIKVKHRGLCKGEQQKESFKPVLP